MVDYKQLDQQAREIIQNNDRGTYTVPTNGLYPYQWNWDSAFTAFGFAEFDVPRAWIELETLLSGQWQNGMVPHILFHQKNDEGYFPGPDVWGTASHLASSGISQPPVAATFARKVFEKSPETGLPVLKQLFPQLCRWHEWFMAYRFEKYGIATTHPWESGRDNAVEWDIPMTRIDTSKVGSYQRRDIQHVNADMRPTKQDYDRYLALVYFGKNCQWQEDVIRSHSPFRVCDPTLTFTLLRANRDLSWLGKQIGADIGRLDDISAQLEQASSHLWDDAIQSYGARDVRTGDFCSVISNASFLCWYAGVKNDTALETLQKIISETPYAVPSHPITAPEYDGNRYWRGPVWAIMNTMIGMGLAECGYKDLAEQIRQKTEDLIIKGGFAEYFNPKTGDPAGGSTFSWTAACWLAWISPTATSMQEN